MLEDINQKENTPPIEQSKNIESVENQVSETLIEEAHSFISETTDSTLKDAENLSQQFNNNPEVQDVITESNSQIIEISQTANEQINQLKNPESTELELQPLKDESREEYLNRLSGELINKNLYGNSKINLLKGFGEWSTLDEDTLKIVFSNLNNIPNNSPLNDEKNKKNLELLRIGIDGKNLTEKDEKNFDLTNRERTFFYRSDLNKGRAINSDKASYSASMFTIPKVRIQEQMDYLKKCIDDKNIYLLGGGYSCLDLLNSEDLKPSKIINIDPFVDENKLDGLTKNSKTEYRLLKEDAAGENLLEKINTENLPKADEIWASYSVPMYLDNPDQIKKLFANISMLLNTGGKCRIFPISIRNCTTENCDSIRESIKNIIDTKKFNIYITKSDTSYNQLVIEKIQEENAK